MFAFSGHRIALRGLCIRQSMGTWLQSLPRAQHPCLQRVAAKSFASDSKSKKRSIGILGVPVNKGQPNPGVMYGPAAIRKANLISEIPDKWEEIHDYGDLEFEVVPEDANDVKPFLKNSRTLGKALHKISDKVNSIVSSGEVCIVLGGDHSLSTGSILGHARAEPDICILWIDAHADINVPSASPTGNMHGMVLSFCINELHKYMPSIPGMEWIKPAIPASRIAFIGLRELDPSEKYAIDLLNITTHSICEVDKYGMPEVLARSMDAINPKGNLPIHLSFDIDSLDPLYSPSTGTPVPGGLTFREGMYLAEEVSKTGLMSAMDLVEVNPTIGSQVEQDQTVGSAVSIIAAALGKKRSGSYPRDYKLPLV